MHSVHLDFHKWVAGRGGLSTEYRLVLMNRRSGTDPVKMRTLPCSTDPDRGQAGVSCRAIRTEVELACCGPLWFMPLSPWALLLLAWSGRPVATQMMPILIPAASFASALGSQTPCILLCHLNLLRASKTTCTVLQTCKSRAKAESENKGAMDPIDKPQKSPKLKHDCKHGTLCCHFTHLSYVEAWPVHPTL